MDSSQFNVIVDGTVLEGFDAESVLLQLTQQLKLPRAKAQLLIAGKPLVVKRDAQAATAQAYCTRLQSLGVNARIEPIPTPTGPQPSETITPALQTTERQMARYFSDAALTAHELHRTPPFTKAILRANLALGAAVFGYGILTLFSAGLLFFYLVRYAPFLTVPPLLFSATVYLSVSLILAGIFALLLRPFLPRQAENQTEILLPPMQEPMLFAFIKQLCDKLACKPPEQIVLTTAAINAVALLPGAKNIKHGDYRLTLSLPLLENSSLNQLAGVLAADLATETTPAMLRYRWLANVVQQQLQACLTNRDWLARRIAAFAQSAPAKVSGLLNILRRIIEPADQCLRKITAHVAHIDKKLLRPLLLERDRYNAQIAGSDHFSERMIFCERLAIATQDANAKNLEHRPEGSFVDDLPALIKHYYDGLEENFARTLQRKWEAETTPRSGEPPIMRERLERVSATPKPSLLKVDSAALALLQMRNDLAKNLTLATYRNANVSFDPAQLTPVEDLTYAATQDILQRQQAAIYFNDWFRPFRFWSLADYQLISAMPLQDAAAQLSVCVNEIRRLTPDRAKLLAEYHRLQNQLHEILLAQHVLAAGKKPPLRHVNFDGASLTPVLEERQQDIAKVMEKLSQQETVMGGRITLGLRLSGQEEREIRDLHDAIRLLHDFESRLYKLSLDCFQLEQLLQRHHQLREADYSLPIKKLETKIDDTTSLLLTRLNDIPYPVDSRRRSLKSFVEATLAQPVGAQRSPILQRAQRLIDAIYRANEKLSRQAAEYGGIAEEAYRIEPIKLINGAQ